MWSGLNRLRIRSTGGFIRTLICSRLYFVRTLYYCSCNAAFRAAVMNFETSRALRRSDLKNIHALRLRAYLRTRSWSWDRLSCEGFRLGGAVTLPRAGVSSSSSTRTLPLRNWPGKYRRLELSNKMRNLSNFRAAIFTTAPSHTDWAGKWLSPPVLPSISRSPRWLNRNKCSAMLPTRIITEYLYNAS